MDVKLFGNMVLKSIRFVVGETGQVPSPVNASNYYRRGVTHNCLTVRSHHLSTKVDFDKATEH